MREYDDHLSMPKSTGKHAAGSHGGILNSVDIGVRVQALKDELDDLIRLAGCGFEGSPRIFYCHKCGACVDRPLANDTQIASLVPKEVSSNVAHIQDKQGVSKAVYSGNDNGIEVVKLDTDVRASGSATNQNVTVLKEHEEVWATVMVGNTYNRRNVKSLKEVDLGTENALVLWVNGGQEGGIDEEAVHVEETEGFSYEPLECCHVEETTNVHAIEVGPQPSNWVIQKMQEFSKLVGVSCDGYESKLIQLFEELEASRGQGMCTSGGKARRKGVRELKRLECSVNYGAKGGKTRKVLLGRDDGAFK